MAAETELQNRLDSLESIAAADPADMLGLVEKLADQCADAVRIAEEAPLPQRAGSGPVVVLGMGGSAIGGDLVGALTAESSRRPVWVNREYGVPGFVGEETLVIASSYSGNTEEVLSAYQAAKERGAQLVAVTGGGKLAEQAESDGAPLVRIPSGLPPRAAIGYAFFTLYGVLKRLGAVESGGAGRVDVDETIELLRAMAGRLGRETPTEENAAKQLALQLYGKLPWVYGSVGWKGSVAYRWKCQINENAKAPAVWNVFPELNHNEICAWLQPEEVNRRSAVVLLRDAADPDRIDRRLGATTEVIAGAVAGVHEVWAEGSSDLARMFSLIYFGDFTSVYLAILYGTDPTPVAAIEELKVKLAEAAG